MARRVDAADTPVLARNALAVTLLSLVTFGMYAAWWSYAANRELARYGRARDRRLQPWIRVRPLVAAIAMGATPILAVATWVARSQSHAALASGGAEMWRLWTWVAPFAGAALSAWVAYGTLERVRTAQGLSGIVAEDTAHPAAGWAWIALAVAGAIVGLPAALWTGWAQRQLNRTWRRYEVVAPAALVPIGMPAHAGHAASTAVATQVAPDVAVHGMPLAGPYAAPAPVPTPTPTPAMPHVAWPDVPMPAIPAAPVPWGERPTMAVR